MKCEVCDNDYDRALEISVGGRNHVFDCFECAVEKLAPRCATCGTRVIGHGLQAGADIYCCATCAEGNGVKGFVDRLDG
jgi:hypothetical protein